MALQLMDDLRMKNAVANLGPRLREAANAAGQAPPVLALVCEEVERLRREVKHRDECIQQLDEDAKLSDQRYCAARIMAEEISASLNYERNKTFWQKVRGLFE